MIERLGALRELKYSLGLKCPAGLLDCKNSRKRRICPLSGTINVLESLCCGIDLPSGGAQDENMPDFCRPQIVVVHRQSTPDTGFK